MEFAVKNEKKDKVNSLEHHDICLSIYLIIEKMVTFS